MHQQFGFCNHVCAPIEPRFAHPRDEACRARLGSLGKQVFLARKMLKTLKTVAMTAAHHTRQSLLAQLDAWSISTKTVDHEPLFTVEQSTKVHREVEGAHTKNLFLKDKKGALFLVTAEHATQVNLKNLHKKLRCGRLSFGNADLMQAHLGVTPGSVTALAVINDVDHTVTFVLDANLMNAAIINAHPLENTATTSIARDDLLAFVEKTGHDVRIVDLESDLVDSA